MIAQRPVMTGKRDRSCRNLGDQVSPRRRDAGSQRRGGGNGREKSLPEATPLFVVFQDRHPVKRNVASGESAL